MFNRLSVNTTLKNGQSKHKLTQTSDFFRILHSSINLISILESNDSFWLIHIHQIPSQTLDYSTYCFLANLAPGSWSSLGLMSKSVHCLKVLWFKTPKKWYAIKMWPWKLQTYSAVYWCIMNERNFDLSL